MTSYSYGLVLVMEVEGLREGYPIWQGAPKYQSPAPSHRVWPPQAFPESVSPFDLVFNTLLVEN